MRQPKQKNTLLMTPSDSPPDDGPRSDWPDLPELPSFTIQHADEYVARQEPPESLSAEDAAAAFRPDEDAILERHAGTGLIRHDAPLNEANIDPDAAKVVRRLERSGYQAYLVGGCVRDLLLNGRPKDFDVATNARPEDVRGLFRNCRIIGRRFRLAHILFGGGKVIEVATFRRNPQVENPGEDDAPPSYDDLLIRSDNVFGDAHEDALRRDFTINALFYDLDRRQVLDWCGAMQDIQRRAIHTIGNPVVRFREDPIRILRAIKFAARLDLGIDPDVYEAMVGCRDELAKAARPRIFEEILRLLRGGAAHRSMWLLWETGIMAVLIPELSAFLDDGDATDGGADRFWRSMDIIDEMTKERGGPLDDVVLFTTLLREPLEEATSGVRDRGQATLEFIDPIIARIALPRRVADAMRGIAALKPRLWTAARSLPEGEVPRLGRLARSEVIVQALDVVEIDLRARQMPAVGLQSLRRELPAELYDRSRGTPRRRAMPERRRLSSGPPARRR
ncbi:polynucleotide adenylyltransferase PcnB [Pendulispora brunnea]|uniref:Poly(A) polymerase I n=1 Tax=Pendulispora brunnea TaxID=2905690 RepID=A0ABZ2KB47_9BACT